MKTNVNKTNVSIKFNSIEEYREIEKKLIEMGYVNYYKHFNESLIELHKQNIDNYVYIKIKYRFIIIPRLEKGDYTYNSLEEFLKD